MHSGNRSSRETYTVPLSRDKRAWQRFEWTKSEYQILSGSCTKTSRARYFRTIFFHTRKRRSLRSPVGRLIFPALRITHTKSFVPSADNDMITWRRTPKNDNLRYYYFFATNKFKKKKFRLATGRLIGWLNYFTTAQSKIRRVRRCFSEFL